jgi:predicted CoA-binding protein/acyl-coenzyme A synthetase/AMP-(fatty) acid ligase
LEHLIDFFDRYIQGPSEALVYDDGFRQWAYTYDQLRATAEAFAGQLVGAGLQTGDRLLIWSDSRPEWVAAFWACVLCGVTVVPVDAAASPDLIGRIVKVAEPRGILAGDRLAVGPVPAPTFVWRVRHIRWRDSSAPRASHGGAATEPGFTRARVDPLTTAEIVFTSGTTGEPKGVAITHGNILANITPIEWEVIRYRRYLWLFRPIRFLNLLPLSHMFGQALAMFFPPLVNAASVFVTGYNRDQIIAQTRRHRITFTVTVPRMLDMLHDRIRQRAPRNAAPGAAEQPWPVRLWRHRDVHRLSGWRFCGFVLGGAALDQALEEFWRRLGFAVIQGYGLTETAPIVAWNHPFKPKHGTVGRPLEGVEVRIAADGEILVKGPTVHDWLSRCAPGQSVGAHEQNGGCQNPDERDHGDEVNNGLDWPAHERRLSPYLCATPVPAIVNAVRYAACTTKLAGVLIKHMTREEALERHVLQRAPTVAIIRASPSPTRHSHTVAAYLKAAGYDVIPIRPDGIEVAGLATYRTLADVAGPVDLVVIFRRPDAVSAHIRESAAKHVETVWLPPGVWSSEAEAAAYRHDLTLIKERCVAEEHRHLSQQSGHPSKWAVHVRRQKSTYEDNRRRPDDVGYVVGGGGGHAAGGGVRSILDEKKMVKGAPSRRSGPFKPKPR